MPIYKSKNNNSYYIKVYVKDKNGIAKQVTKRNKLWIGRKGKELAQQEEIRLKISCRNASYELEKMTVEKLCKNYLEYIKSSVRQSSYDRYETMIKTHIIPYLGSEKVNSLSVRKVIEWHKKLDNYTSIKNKHLSLTTKQMIHCMLSSIFKYGCKFYNIERNIPNIVGNFKAQNGTVKEEKQILTLNEFFEFIKYEENETYRLFFTILFFTGLRRGELLALQWEDIDFEENSITISKTMSIRPNSKIEKPKTNKSNRTIQMIDYIKNILLEIKKENGFIFEPNSIKGTTLADKCRRNCRKANICKNIRIHDFRHSFASLCINREIPIAIISNYLGHENISTTLNVYSHLYPNSQNKLLEKLNFL